MTENLCLNLSVWSATCFRAEPKIVSRLFILQSLAKKELAFWHSEIGCKKNSRIWISFWVIRDWSQRRAENAEILEIVTQIACRRLVLISTLSWMIATLEDRTLPLFMQPSTGFAPSYLLLAVWRVISDICCWRNITFIAGLFPAFIELFGI